MIFNILLFLFLFYIFYSGFKKYRKIHKNELLGPFPIPILGNLHQLGKEPHNTLTDMHRVYGDIFRLHFGDVYTVVVSDPILIREMYSENHENFKNRVPLPSVRYSSSEIGIVFTSKNWTKVRGTLQNAMKRTSIKKIYQMYDNSIFNLIKSIQTFHGNSSGEPIDIQSYSQRFSISIIFKYIFDEDISYDEDITGGEIARLYEPMDEIIKLLGYGCLGDYISILQPFYYQWLKLTDGSISTIKKQVSKRYLKHLETIDYNNPRDLMDTLIMEFPNDKDLIIQLCLEFILAGTETTASSINWFVLRMQEYPDIQLKAYNEIKEVVGNRDRVLLSDRPKTPYLNAIIKELLRLNPVGPFGIPHCAINDIVIGNGRYFIPKGSQILPNLKAVGLNENYFENPSKFNPNRFLNNNKSNDAYIPFGVGKRNCIGLSLASDEQYLSFSNLLLNFNFKNIGTPIDDSEENGLTFKPKPFKVLLEPR
ncbi:hypothetical protein ACTA71_010376 [Dictyostelium dimigraforme]